MLLVPFIFISAALAIWADYAGVRRGVYVFKPLTTLLIIGVAAFWGDPISTAYKTLIVVGLCFSLAGDIFLMLPKDQFIVGLGSFFLTHLFYIIAFLDMGKLIWWLVFPLLLFGGGMLVFLFPYLGSMKGPVLAYMVVISLMGWLALSWWWDARTTNAALAALGALLFMGSDSVLALNRFRQSFQMAQLLVLSTYFAAQTLIALSIQNIL